MTEPPFICRLLIWSLVGAIFICRVEARDLTLPDLKLTPGVAVQISVKKLCATKWGKDARKVTPKMKREVFARYGLSGNHDRSCKADKHGRHFEIDHLVSRELGGADDTLNLWPECYSGKWGAAVKDRYENFLHRQICAGDIGLEEARDEIKSNWIEGYRRRIGEPK